MSTPHRPIPPTATRRRVIATAMLCFVAWATCLSARAADIDERKAALVKAAYLRHLASYFTWPDGVFGDDATPIVIAIVGEDPHGVGASLERAVREKDLRAQNRRIEVRRMAYARPADQGDAAAVQAARERFVADLRACHLVFVTRAAAPAWADLRAVIADRPIGTVGEFEAFATSGGMVEFVIDKSSGNDNASVMLHVSLRAIKRVEMRLSARLLGLHRVVRIVENGSHAERGEGER